LLADVAVESNRPDHKGILGSAGKGQSTLQKVDWFLQRGLTRAFLPLQGERMPQMSFAADIKPLFIASRNASTTKPATLLFFFVKKIGA
jgi:hypothetical protein